MLAWSLEWGPQVKHLRRIADTGQRVPALESRPVPGSHISWIWEGFATLDIHRSWGQGFPQPISLSDILAYGQLTEMGRDQMETFLFYVEFLDGKYLDRMANRKK